MFHTNFKSCKIHNKSACAVVLGAGHIQSSRGSPLVCGLCNDHVIAKTRISTSLKMRPVVCLALHRYQNHVNLPVARLGWTCAARMPNSSTPPAESAAVCTWFVLFLVQASQVLNQLCGQSCVCGNHASSHAIIPLDNQLHLRGQIVFFEFRSGSYRMSLGPNFIF